MPTPAVADVVEPLILDGAVAVSAVVLLEMLRFTRSPAGLTVLHYDADLRSDRSDH